MSAGYWDKIAQQRISRRRALSAAGAGGVAVGAALVVGCNGSGSSTPSPAAGASTTAAAPKRGGRYRGANTFDFDTFHPYLAIAGAVFYFPRLYNVLVNFSSLDSTFRFDDLSTGYEQPDALTYNFKIRSGVKVGPNTLGVPERDLDAQDVVTSYQTIVSLPQSNAFPFIGKKMDKNVASGDTYTMTMRGSYAFFRDRIGSPLNTIIPREVLADAAADKLKQQAAGAGPFVLKSYTEGQGAAFDANPNYYANDAASGAQLPYVAGMDVSVITDASAIRTAFQSNQTDVYIAASVDEAKQLQQGSNYTVVRDPVNTFISFTMNPTKDPWKDDRIRMAAMHAINRQDYIDRVYSGEAKANGLVHWPLGEAALSDDELKTLQGYDPQKSKDLIRAATGQSTVKMKLTYPQDLATEQHALHMPIFLQQMKDAGFDIDPDPQAAATWLDNYTNLRYDASLAPNQIYEFPEVPLDFHHSEGPARNHIYAIGVGILYPEIDAAIDGVIAEADHDAFIKKIHDVQRLIYSKGPAYLPLVSPYSFTLYQPRVKNISQGLGNSALYVNNWWLDS